MASQEEPSGNEPDEREHRAERILPEVVRRLLEAGYERLSDTPDNLRQLLSELRLPKEALALLLAQLEDGRHGLYRVVASEIRDFLQRTSLADEFRRAITGIALEVKTEIRVVSKDPPARDTKPPAGAPKAPTQPPSEAAQDRNRERRPSVAPPSAVPDPDAPASASPPPSFTRRDPESK